MPARFVPIDHDTPLLLLPDLRTSGAALRAKAPPFGYLAPLGSYVRTAAG